MIHVFLGTKAQLIKMAPVMVELQNRNIPYNFIFSGQHQATVRNIREEFGLKDPDVTLYIGKDITGIFQMLLWSIQIVFFSFRNRKQVWQGDKYGIVLNHGDTFSTLLGTLLARLAGHRSAHVEAGLRSFRLFSPFPEEITRILTFRLSNIYFAPGEWALSNLKKYRGIKVNTHYNTLLDALAISEQAIDCAPVDIPAGPFALVSLHRFENIFSRRNLAKIVEVLSQVSADMPLLFILHKPTVKKLEQFGLRTQLEQSPNIELRPRYSYFQFMKLTKAATAVITDGGSNQEECFYLGKPCLIMRQATERQEGIGHNAVLVGYDLDRIREVLQQLPAATPVSTSNRLSPSRIIIDTLVQDAKGNPESQ